MTTAGIRKTITAALEHEEQTGALRRSLEQRLPLLQEKLLLPEENPLDALMTFVINYTESVPGSLNLVTAANSSRTSLLAICR